MYQAARVSAEGVAFDQKKVPSDITLTDTSITLMLIPKGEIDPHDITTAVNNGRCRNSFDYTDSRPRRSLRLLGQV